MREQVELTYLIGYDRVRHGLYAERFEDAVCKAASILCGGCLRIRNAEGYWMSDGSEGHDTFSGTLEREYTLAIKLTCELHKKGQVLDAMKATITNMVALWEIETNWVHVQETAIVGHHFNARPE